MPAAPQLLPEPPVPVAVIVPPEIVTVPKPLDFAAPMPEPLTPPIASIVPSVMLSLPVPDVSPTLPPMPGAELPPVAFSLPEPLILHVPPSGM